MILSIRRPVPRNLSNFKPQLNQIFSKFFRKTSHWSLWSIYLNLKQLQFSNWHSNLACYTGPINSVNASTSYVTVRTTTLFRFTLSRIMVLYIRVYDLKFFEHLKTTAPRVRSPVNHHRYKKWKVALNALFFCKANWIKMMKNGVRGSFLS